MIWLSYELWIKVGFSKKEQQWYSLLAGALLVFSPWHVHYSRAGFESGMALTLVLLGFASFYSWIRSKHWLWGVAAISLLVGSLYTYHSAKIFVPIFGLCFLLLNYQFFFKKIKQTFGFSLYGSLLLLPLMYDSFFRSGADRAQQTTLLFSQGSFLEKITTIGENFVEHLMPSFLLMGETTTLRHGDGVWGVLFPSTLILVVAALMWLIQSIKSRSKTSVKFRQLIWLSLLWIGAGLLAPAVGFEVPHSNRALLALPGFLWLAVIGFASISNWLSRIDINKKILGSHGEKNMVVKTFIGSFILFHLFFFVSYISYYFTVFPETSSDAFKAGYIQALDYVLPYERGTEDKPEVEKIIVTSDYGQPYIYALIARKTNPYQYHSGSLIKYEFKEVEIGDLNRPNAIVVAAGDDDLPTKRADKLIFSPGGELRFQIFVTK